MGRDTGQRGRSWVITGSEVVSKDLGNYPIGTGNHEGVLGEGVTRLNMHFRNPTLSAIQEFVP